MASLVPSYHTSPATANHPHHGYYRRVNQSSILWANTRYRILTSSLATMMSLRDSSDDPDAVLIYEESIKKIRAELHTLR